MNIRDLSDRNLLEGATNHRTFQSGRMYYYNDKVGMLHFDDIQKQYLTTVHGNDLYNVRIKVGENENISSFYCGCPAFDKYYGLCKHVIAVLFKIRDELEKNKIIYLNNRKAFIEILSSISSQGIKSSVVITLDITFHVNTKRDRMMTRASFKIGRDRPYVIKDVYEFIKNKKAGLEIFFGKNFTYNPAIHKIYDEDKKIFDIIEDIYDGEKELLELTTFGYNKFSLSAFDKRHVILTVKNLESIFSKLDNKAFNFEIDGVLYENIKIVHDDIPFKLDVAYEGEDIILLHDNNIRFLHFGASSHYFFYDKTIYRVSEKQRAVIEPILKGFKMNRVHKIVFPENYREDFISEVLNELKAVCDVSINDELRKRIFVAELEPSVFLDREGKSITVRVEFKYDDIIVNPFESKRGDKDSRILLRDMEKERSLLSFFEKTGFKVKNGVLHLEDVDEICKFIFDELPRLQNYAVIFYSDQFKNFRLNRNINFTGNISIKEDFLEFSFDFEHIDNDELMKIMDSLKMKKKYYRLKDGTFLPLNDLDLINLSKIINHFDISYKNIDERIITLPKHKAMYLDSILRESENNSINRDTGFKELVRNIKEHAETDYVIPEQLAAILRPYQKTGYKWLKTLIEYGFGGVLADDMGLGKTLQIITFLLSERDNSKLPAIVIAPTTLIYNWKDEVEKFVPKLKTLVISGTQEYRQALINEINKWELIVTSYPLIRNDIDSYKDIEFSYCIIDEAQHIKNPQTQAAKAVKRIKAKGYFALTGTPIENSLTELWSIFDFIMPGYLYNHGKFASKFENPICKENDSDSLNELSRHIRPFIMRRMKTDVLKELPDKIESKISSKLTEGQKKIYLAYLQKAKNEIKDEIAQRGIDNSKIKILAVLTRLRQICCHPSTFVENYKGGSGKLELLNEILDDALDSGHRILLFSQFRSMLFIIERLLKQKNIGYFSLTGSTETKERGTMVRQFNKGERKVFLISLKAGGTGLNLTGADMVIHYDPWWNPAVEEQATDRAYRIGQENVVQVIKLITAGTIEEKIYNMQSRKKELIDSVIKPGETFLSKLNNEEIEKLFEQ